MTACDVLFKALPLLIPPNDEQSGLSQQFCRHGRACPGHPAQGCTELPA
jgi:hypothetical protein